MDQAAPAPCPPPRLTVDMRNALDRWIRYAELPDPFLVGVIANDLIAAVLHATADELTRLPALVTFLRDQAPEQCFGSRNNLAEWLHSQGIAGRERVLREAGL